MKSFLTLFIILLTVSSYAQTGKVGINTTTPAAMLHVKDSSVVFSSISAIPFPGNPPVSGAGSRMMWYPQKAAFRAGTLLGNHSANWDRDSIGNYSIAFGLNTKAKGIFSVAMGSQTQTLGAVSFAMGHATTAVGEYSTAMGYGTKANGHYSTSMGLFTSATGNSSIAMGFYTSASGSASMAMGESTKASGNFSFASGIATKATSFGSMVAGRFNDTTSISSDSWNPLDPVFIIGNGTSNSMRSNALTVLKNGNTGIGDISPDAKFHVSGGTGGGLYTLDTDLIIEDDEDAYIQFSTINSEESGILAGSTITSVRSGIVFRTDSAVQIRAGGNTGRMIIDKSGNVGIGVGTPTQRLHVSGNGLFTGTVTANCGVLICSDIRYKKKIIPVTNALSSLQSIHGIYYNWDSEKFPDKNFGDDRQLGFSAQELEKVYPEMVKTDANGYKTVDYSRLTPVLVEAIKEQQEIILSQEVKLDAVEKELQELKSLLYQIMSSR